MPHKRKVKKGHQTKLIFKPEESFLYLRYAEESPDSFHLPLDSLLSIFILQYIRASDLKVYLVKQPVTDYVVAVRKSVLNFEICEKLPSPAANCRLPVWYLPGQLTCLAGLCSVVRYAIKLVTFTTADEAVAQYVSLLGHQLNCLSAPAEVSTWTNFCEMQIPNAISKFLSSSEVYFPVELSKLETHLRQPIRIHNVRKRMQDFSVSNTNTTKQNGVNGNSDTIKVSAHEEDPIKLYAQGQHVFAEGPDLLVSDLLLVPCIYLLFNSQDEKIREKFPLISRWYDKMVETDAIGILDSLVNPTEKDSRHMSSIEPPEVPDESLYKCDPKREVCKTYTNQVDVERNLSWWEGSGLQNLQSFNDPNSLFMKQESLNWDSLPKLVHPQAGELPADRLERKCQQLAGLVIPLKEIAESMGDCMIVDFCSGGGHLGLLLAHLLPKATIHMVENKEESLARARERGMQLKLNNVWYYQANMEYYQGKFDVGTSLHACGVATDIVIDKSIQQKAHFVCSPCCYGAVQSLDNIKYPRSKAFKVKGCTEKDYLMMGHTADQTQRNTEKLEQGELFMDIVDTDRSNHAVENNYTCVLSKIYPLTCSPKHNIIIATSNERCNKS